MNCQFATFWPSIQSNPVTIGMRSAASNFLARSQPPRLEHGYECGFEDGIEGASKLEAALRLGGAAARLAALAEDADR